MNNITDILRKAPDLASFAAEYGKYVASLLARLDVQGLGAIVSDLEAARAGDHAVFVAGNGGSAATAAHVVNDLVFGTRTADGAPTFRVFSLSDSIGLFTAIANDTSYEEVFVRQLEQYFRPGDRLLVISASGNSPNVLAAARWVKRHGGRVLGLLGFDGGAARALCDAAVVVATPKGEYGPVEDVHLVIDHLLTIWLQHQARTAAAARSAGV
jgi:D-sedoheptulose 7-phosphate isomerase